MFTYRAPTSLKQFKRDLTELLVQINSKSAQAILITPQKPKLYSTWIEIHTIERYSNVVLEAVAKNGNPLIHHFEMDLHIDGKSDVLLDGLHLSESGHGKIARALEQLIASAETS
jgi:lysophospholipase L1-like esterase